MKKIQTEELNLNLKVAWSSVQNRCPALLTEDFLAFSQIIRADICVHIKIHICVQVK